MNPTLWLDQSEEPFAEVQQRALPARSRPPQRYSPRWEPRRKAQGRLGEGMHRRKSRRFAM